MQSAFSHDVHMLTIADPHRPLAPLQVPLIPQILLQQNLYEIPTCYYGHLKKDINYMYIKYTFLSGNNLSGLLVFKVLEAFVLPVTI
jgi:hypothetical protein